MKKASEQQKILKEKNQDKKGKVPLSQEPIMGRKGGNVRGQAQLKTVQQNGESHDLHQKQNIKPQPKGILKQSKYKSPLSEQTMQEEEEDENTPEDKVSAAKVDEVICEQLQETEEESGFQLLPQPLLSLRHMHGQSRCNQGNVHMISKGVIGYVCDNVLIMMNERSMEQRYLFAGLKIGSSVVDRSRKQIVIGCQNVGFYDYQSEHQHVNHIWNNSSNNIVQQKKKKQMKNTKQQQQQQQQQQQEQRRCAEILVFDQQTCQKVSHYELQGYYDIFSMSISNDGYLVVCALDNLQRYTIVVIRDERIVLKQISPFHICRLRIIDPTKYGNGLVSVGKENVRFWDDCSSQMLQGHSPYLGEYTRECNLTDLWVGQGRVLASCNGSGRVFAISLESRELMGVWQLCDSRIICMRVEQYKHMVMTTHQDQSIRFWKQDFSEVIFEIKLESEVIDVDGDGGMVVCSQSNGQIGILDIKSRQYSPIVNSHVQDIIDISYHQPTNKLISMSMDHTIRIWTITQSILRQEYEYRCLDALGTALCTFTQRNQVICGFDNGLIRLFDLKKHSIIAEIDTNTSINSIHVNNIGTLILVSHNKQSHQFNADLQIIKEHPQSINNGFNWDHSLYYLLSAHQLLIYSTNSFEEICRLQLQSAILSLDMSSPSGDVLLALRDQQSVHRIRKYSLKDRSLHLLQEVVIKHTITTILATNQYILVAGGQDFVIYDYHFRGDFYGVPDKQLYNIRNNITKVIIVGSDMIYSFTKNFIFAWQIKTQFNITPTNDVVLGQQQQQQQQQINITQADKQWHIDNQSTTQQQQYQVISTNKKKQKQNTSNKNQQVMDNNELMQQHTLPPIPIPPPINTVVLQPPQLPQPTLPTDNQLIINQIYGYNYNDHQQLHSIPWIKQHKYYLLSAYNNLTQNYLNQEHTQYILPIHEVITQVHTNIDHTILLILLNTSLKLYAISSQLNFIKTITATSTILHAIISQCSNYLLLITQSQPYLILEVIDIPTTRVLATSPLTDFHPKTQLNINFCGDKTSLTFLILSPTTAQLWRLNNRAHLEYLTLSIPSTTTGLRSFAQISLQNKPTLLIAQGHTINALDLQSAKLTFTIQSITQQEISSLINLHPYLILLTLSPNVYYYTAQNNLEDSKPIIISLDSIPIAYSHHQTGTELLIACKSGVLWYVDFATQVTLKIQHSLPFDKYAIQSTFSNQTLVTANSDGTVQLWRNYELLSEYILPKRQCNTVQLVDGFIIAGYDDSYVRIFSLTKNQLLGEAIPTNHPIIDIKVINTQFLIFLIADLNGSLSLCKLIHKQQNEIQLIIQHLDVNPAFAINMIDVSSLQPNDFWGLATKNGKIMILQRQEFQQEIKITTKPIKTEPYSDLSSIQYYLIDSYKFSYKPITQLTDEGLIQFSQSDHDLIMIAVKNQKLIIIRNFKEHAVIPLQLIDQLEYKEY